MAECHTYLVKRATKRNASHFTARVWYHTGKPPVSIRWVLVRDSCGKYEPIALLSTDTTLCPNQIANWYVRRWRMEVTFEAVRAHLGVETQRQWSDKAIARTTPMLFGLFSWITLAGHLLVQQNQVEVRKLHGIRSH
jgi:hypothetical protein